MKNQPIVSCIIPTYNRQYKVLKAALSVLNQTYSNIELLIIDDQSEDNTKTMIRLLEESDNRVKYYYNPVKGGNNARNYGIKHSKGKFIAFLDDDDQWHPEKLARQLKYFSKNPSAGLVFTAFKRFVPGKKKRRHPSYLSIIKNDKILNRLLVQNFITTSTILVKKDVFKDVGLFDPNLGSFQDWDLLTRIAMKYQLVYLNRVLVYQYESKDSITLDKKNRISSSIQLLKKYSNIYKNNPMILSKRYSYLGLSLVKQQKYILAHNLFIRGLKKHPLNIKNPLGIAVVRHKRRLQTLKQFFSEN